MARAHKTDCKGTAFFWNTQIFSEKNVFFLIKSMIILLSLYVHDVILTLKCVTLALLAVCNVILTLKCVTFVTFVTLRRCAPRCFDINANVLMHCFVAARFAARL